MKRQSFIHTEKRMDAFVSKDKKKRKKERK